MSKKCSLVLNSNIIIYNTMKKIVFSLVLSMVMIATAMAQEEKSVVKASANTTTTNYETTESSSGGFWSERPFIKGARFNAYFDFGFSVGGYDKYDFISHKV